VAVDDGIWGFLIYWQLWLAVEQAQPRRSPSLPSPLDAAVPPYAEAATVPTG